MVFQGSFMVFHGSWFGSHDFLRYFHGFSWFLVSSDGFLRFSWFFMDLGCLTWFFKVASWFFMVLGWFSWFYKVVSWFFMILGWFSWLFKIFVVFQGSFTVFHGFGQMFVVVYWFLCMNDQILFHYYISGHNCLRVVMCPLKMPGKRADTNSKSYSVIRTTTLYLS